MKFSNSWYMSIPNLAMPRETCEEVQSSDRTAFSLNPVKNSEAASVRPHGIFIMRKINAKFEVTLT